MSKKVYITISGQVGTGKTSIAQILEKSLNECGIEVEVNDVDMAIPADDPIFCLKNTDIEVVIDVKQLNRKAIWND